MKHFALLVFIAISSLSSISSGNCTHRYSVGLDTFPPLFFRDSEGNPQGADYDLISALMQKMNCRFTFQEMTRPVAREELRRSRVDIVLILTAASYPENEKNFITLFGAAREMIVRKSKFVPGKVFKDYITDKKVIFGNLIGSQGSLKQNEEQLLRSEGRVKEVPDGAKAFDLLLNGKVDAVVSVHFLNKYYFDRFKMHKDYSMITESGPHMEVGMYISPTRLSVSEKADIKKAVQELRQSGAFLNALSKYMKEDPSDLVLSK